MNIVAWTTPDGSVFCDEHKPLTGYEEDELHPVFDIDEGSDDTAASCEQCVWEQVQYEQRKRNYELVQYWVEIFTGAGLDDKATILHDLWNKGHETEAVVLATHYANNNTIKDME